MTSRILQELRSASIEDYRCVALGAGLILLGVML